MPNKPETEEINIYQGIRMAATVTGTVVFIILCVQSAGLFQIFENDLFDFQSHIWRQHKAMPEEIVLVLIDEASLSAMESFTGRWPWQRAVFADFIDFLALGGAKSIVFDILFTELSSAPASELSFGDARLVQATQNAANVIHASQTVLDDPDPLKPTSINASVRSPAYKNSAIKNFAGPVTSRYTTIYWPFEALRHVAVDIGVTSFSPDDDGVYRGAELLFQYQDQALPSLSLATLLNRSQETVVTFEPQTMVFSSPSLERSIPLDGHNRYWVNLYGRYDAYSFSGVYLSLMRLRQGEVDNLPVHPDRFKDKVVFVGASAAGVEDLKTTGLGRQTPGVLLHASIYGNIISDDMLLHAPWWVNFTLLFMAVAITSAVIFFCRRAWISIVISIAVLAMVCGITFSAFPTGWLIKSIPPICGVIGTYLAAFTWVSFSTHKEKRKIRNILGQYVSPAILDSVLTDHKEAFLSAEVGQRRLLTLQFSDLRGFTSIAEDYPVERVVALLNDYLATMVDEIFNHHGTLDKFIGDAILAFWGAPIMDEAHAYKAVSCAIDMQRALKRLNERNRLSGLPVLRAGFGIHTAEVILGNIGSQKKLDYTVIGDGVNLTSRLESLTKTYHCPILISQQTYEAAGQYFCCRTVDKVTVKGKAQCTQIYEVIERAGAEDEARRQIARLSNEGFSFYTQRKFQKAMKCYEEILKLDPADTLGQIFTQRSMQYTQLPPAPGWAGECVMDHK
jgi:adenylate cyclase